jgi:hypothetical protein
MLVCGVAAATLVRDVGGMPKSCTESNRSDHADRAPWSPPLNSR